MSSDVVEHAAVGTSAAPARPMDRASGRRRLAGHAVIILSSVVMIYPLLWLATSSFKHDTEIFSSAQLLPHDWDFANYAEGWTELGVSFDVFFANSLFISLAAVIGNVLSCSLAAYAFARLNFRLRRFWFAVMLLTVMLPVHVTLVPQYTIFNRLGLVNTFYPLIVPQFLAVEAFFIFLLVQFIRGLPIELDEAARLDGCGPPRIFWHIILPLLRPALVTTAIFSFIWSYNNFFGQLIYLGDTQIYTVPLALRMFMDATGESSWGPLFAMSLLSLVPAFALFLGFQRWIVDGIATTGSKM
ncbi:carbohydrate ABC transporter permease [Georgenia deserti]|uniref:Carbohydrate ABC transporter permease n=1 Tax=Georgenia deserti TaxID=2093781 RepID=A0ABW4L7E3_9MICO